MNIEKLDLQNSPKYILPQHQPQIYCESNKNNYNVIKSLSSCLQARFHSSLDLIKVSCLSVYIINQKQQIKVGRK